MQNIVFYISAHGFGHASRDIEVINEISRLKPDARIVIRSNVPKWFVEASWLRGQNERGGEIDLQPLEADTGIVQIDSLALDEEQTARLAARFYGDFGERVRAEAAVLEQVKATIVVGDIPPLAFAAAARARVPAVALSNFTWDWIYEGYPQFEQLARGVIGQIRAAYALATRALRLPFHGGFAGFSDSVTDIPLIARHSRRPRADTRRILVIADAETVVLASFGGYGLGLDYDDIARQNGLTVIVTDQETSRRRQAPRLQNRPAETAGKGTGVIRTTSAELSARGLVYADLVAASDIVVTKPGYGIVSECIANRTALLYTSRGRFREYQVLVDQMPAYLRCREIAQDDLRAGRWREAAMALLDQPSPPGRLPTNGAEVAAQDILDM